MEKKVRWIMLIFVFHLLHIKGPVLHADESPDLTGDGKTATQTGQDGDADEITSEWIREILENQELLESLEVLDKLDLFEAPNLYSPHDF